jgi:hypothetical protein
MTTIQKLLSDNNISYSAYHVGVKDTSDEWEIIIINDNTGHSRLFKYFTGFGRRKPPKMSISEYSRAYGMGYKSKYIQDSTPVTPKIEDILSCLVSEYFGSKDTPFEQWANEYGYDTDSIKVLNAYNAILENNNKLLRILSNDILEGILEIIIKEELL